MASRRTPEDFGEAFTELLAVAGLTVSKVVAKGLGVGRTTLYEWMKGDHLPEPTGPLLSVVELCLDLAAKRDADLGMLPCDAEGWLHLLAEAKQTRHSRRAGRFTSGTDAADPAIKRPDRLGQPVGRWGPVALGVHKTVGGGALTSYVRRSHDDLLYSALDPAVAANRLVVLRGDSSTGKSRAAYQAVVARLPNWPLFYPPTATALSRLLEEGIPRRSVLWLNELRHYADDPDGVQPLSALAQLLRGTSHIVAITTLWLDSWATYTADHHDEPGAADPSLAIRDLLRSLPELSGTARRRLDVTRGGVIDVPDQFTDEQLAEARRRGDAIVQEALATAESAGAAGRLTQFLAGVPDLLDHYQGPGADPYGQALIKAAMDAVRLGHTHLLTQKLLQQAAVGYLAPRHRALVGKELAACQERAWKYATRTLKGAFQALEPVPPEEGFGVAGYRLADSLDQYGHRHRADQMPPRAFWTATAHAHPGDLRALGDAAWDRGLYRDAVRLYRHATTNGDPRAARILIHHLHALHPTDHRPARWAASHVSLHNPGAVAELLSMMQEIGASEQVTALAERAATQVALDDPQGVAKLLVRLREVGANEQATALARRAATQIALNNLHAVVELLSKLQEMGADEQVTALAERAATQVVLDNPREVAELLVKLREVGADEHAALLAKRAATHASLHSVYEVAELLSKLREMGADQQVTALAERVTTQATLNKAAEVAWLFATLRRVGASEQVTALAERAATQVVLDNPQEVAELLVKLREVGANEQATALAQRAATQIALNNLHAVVELLSKLQEMGADEQVTALAERAATQVVLDNPQEVAELLVKLREVGADEHADALIERVAALEDPYFVAQLLVRLHEIGGQELIAELLAHNLVAQVVLDDPREVAELFIRLREIGANEHAAALAERAATQVALKDPYAVARLLGMQERVRAHEQTAELLARNPAAQVALDDPGAVALLLGRLWLVRAHEQISQLLARNPAAQVALDKPDAVAQLLDKLRHVGAQEQVTTLVKRAATLDDARAVAELLVRLREIGGHELVAELLAHDPAAQTVLDDPRAATLLLSRLWHVGAQKQASALAERAATQVALYDAYGVTRLMAKMREVEARDKVAILAKRVTTQATLYSAYPVDLLLDSLREAGAQEQIAELIERLPAAGFFDLYIENCNYGERFRYGRELDGSVAAAWGWAPE